MGDVLYQLFQLLVAVARLDSSDNIGELWVVRAVGWCWVSGAGGCCGQSRRGGAARGVEYLGHLAMVDAARVVTEGHVSVLVLEGFGLMLVASVVLLRR